MGVKRQRGPSPPSLPTPPPVHPQRSTLPFECLFASWGSVFSAPPPFFFYKLPADISLGAAPGQLLSKSLIQQAKPDRIPNNPEPALPAFTSLVPCADHLTDHPG